MEILILDSKTKERIGISSFNYVPQVGTKIVIGNIVCRYGQYLQEMVIQVEDVYTFSQNCMDAKDALSTIPDKFLIQNENWGMESRYRLPQVLVMGEVVNNHLEFTNTHPNKCDINLDYIRKHPE